MSREDFERTLAENPNDTEAYLVYADWLQSQGDRQGELIAVEHKLATGGANKELEKAAQALRAELAGGLIEYEPYLKLEWHLGFIKSARVALEYDASHEATDIVRDLLAHPSARLLQGFTAGLVDAEGENYYDGVIEVMVAAGARPSMRRLFIGDFEYPDETEISWSGAGDVGKLWPLYPRLEEVIVQAGSMSLGRIDLPEALQFEVRTGGLARGCIDSICSATWPKLRKLEIWFGSESYGAEGDLDSIRPLLEAQNIPSVVELGLRNAEFTDGICRELPGSKVLPRLTRLDLSMGIMTDDGARAIADESAAYAHLSVLDVSENYLSDEGLNLLRAALGDIVVSGDQREDDDPEYRYASVGE
jgi:uncharacterized protein (TIGR02996 family)